MSAGEEEERKESCNISENVSDLKNLRVSEKLEEKTSDNQISTDGSGNQSADTEGDVEEDTIFTRISKDDDNGVAELLSKNKALVSELDKHGMTPLHHAAYKGKKSMCQLLLDNGADVNGGNHNNGYTALHFAALSGNASLCQLLLQEGAKPYAQNSVNRTASQMAAFVGNHHVVATINSFVDFNDVEYFTKSNSRPRLDPVAARSLHRLIMDVNFHPIRVAMTVKESAVLLEHLSQAYKVLEEMAVREMKKGSEGSEIVAFKLHMLSFALKSIQTETNGDVNRFEDFIKSLLRTRNGQHLSEPLEVFLRRGVRDFKFLETTIMHQLVQNLSHTKVCEEPGAWSIICSVVNGQKGFCDNDPCATCGEERGVKRCSRCHYDAYCDQECQRLHWFMHKKYCKEKAKEYAARQASQQAEKA